MWILMQSVSPQQAASWIADKRDALRDREFRAIYLEYDAAFDWSPDDPRLPVLANRAQRWIANRSRKSKRGKTTVLDPTIAQLAATSLGGMSPAWDRLGELAKQR